MARGRRESSAQLPVVTGIFLLFFHVTRYPVVTGYSINWDFFFEGPDIRLLNEIFRNRPLLHMDFDLEVSLKSLKLRDFFNEPVLVRASARAIGFNMFQLATLWRNSEYHTHF